MVDEVESFVAAAEVLKQRGAYKIYVVATHGLLSADAPQLLENSYIDEVGEYTVDRGDRSRNTSFYIQIKPFRGKPA